MESVLETTVRYDLQLREEPMARRWLRYQPFRQTLGEDLRMARSWRVVFLWIARLLRRPFGAPMVVPWPVPLRDFELDEACVPADVRSELAPWLDQLEALGFEGRRWRRYASANGADVTHSVSLRSIDGSCIGRLSHVWTGMSAPIVACLLSELPDGRSVVTVNRPRSYDPVEPHRTLHAPRAPPDRLLALHRAALREVGSPVLVRDVDAMVALEERQEEAGLGHMLARGLWLEVPEPGEAVALAEDETLDPVERGVLAEMGRIEDERTSVTGFLVMALATLALFVGVGGLHWSWRLALVLAGVLVVHEAGHWIAMKALGYRNLRMFFLPLLGAAVTGRSWDAQGWKRAVVALAGPLPGIVAGALLAAVASITEQPLVREVAVMALVLNGINLVPVLPLDGGWVLHAILFSRHPILEVAFRVAAVAALLVVGLLGIGKVLVVLGLLMAAGIPGALRRARVARLPELRDLPAPSGDDPRLPRETVLALCRTLRREAKVEMPPAVLAREALAVYQNVSGRPPRLLASSGLLAAHAAGVVLALLGVALVMSAADTASIPRAAPRTPSRSWTGAESVGDAGGRADALLGAHFPGEAEASAWSAEAGGRLAPGERLTRFGQTVLLATSAERADAWRSELGRRPGGVQDLSTRPDGEFIERPTAMLACTAPDAETARRLAQEVGLACRQRWLAPPWAGRDDGDDTRRSVRAGAALALRALREAESDPALLEANARAAELETDDAYEAVEAAYEAAEAAHRDAARRLAERLVAESREPVDAAVLAAVIAAGDPALGLHDDIPAPPGFRPHVDAAVDCAEGGAVVDGQGGLALLWVEMERLDVGLPAMTSWLAANGCTDIRYEIVP